ncbi:sodium-translocating pyrophosphatase [Halochromatium salexigens]|uniref:K(+)-insensitive pyrophosphate-energized proton pump n=1 Tax=Halochromatium salexigens TaxID=49447 RepID=A0AAJ0UD02_HALSE|nr:sodium-translocating pyrophosphatase [Halochromatium salexigens]MBK5929239.1 sodium-translocating pyrophosphatase [Halochromatium salexigens]
MSLGLIFALLCAIVALGHGLTLVSWVLVQPRGNERMQQVAKTIWAGASAYLHRQYLTVTVVGLLMMAGLSHWFGVETGIGFLIGALLSGAAGYLGMQISVRANLRTAEAARKGVEPALQVALRGGAITGLLVIGLALLGVVGYYMILVPHDAGDIQGQMRALHALLGLAFGGSLSSIFARLGGGIFSKSADVGAAIVGKVEVDLREDDQRNPVAIADMIGDQVGDCAGMAADLFETYVLTLVASMLLGGLLLGDDGANAIVYPLLLGGISVLASAVGVFFVKIEPDDSRIMTALYKGTTASGVLAFIFFVPVTWMYLPATFTLQEVNAELSRWGVLGAAAVGLGLTGLMTVISEYYTGIDYAPVRSIAKASSTGHATNVIAGLGVSMRATAAPALVICVAIWAAHEMAGVYGIAIAATTMLSMTGIILALNSFGPIADSAAGIAEMAEMGDPVRAVTASLDAVGNSTKAMTKGFAIGSAGLVALVLFADFTYSLAAEGRRLSFTLDDPVVLIGLFIGGLVPYLFSAMALEAVGRTAAGLVEHMQAPDASRLVERLSTATIKEMLIPSLLPVAVPLAIGFGMQWLIGGDAGALALGGLLIGTIITGLFVALSMTLGGGAWDNAKQYIEAGHIGGKGGDAHAAAVTGDSVGDPYKDTAGSAVNPVIKLINIVALLMVPLL